MIGLAFQSSPQPPPPSIHIYMYIQKPQYIYEKFKKGEIERSIKTKMKKGTYGVSNIYDEIMAKTAGIYRKPSSFLSNSSIRSRDIDEAGNVRSKEQPREDRARACRVVPRIDSVA